MPVPITRRAVSLLAMAWLVILPAHAQESRDALERQEDLTESLANSLHALSLEIRNRDLGGMGLSFAEGATGTGFGIAPGEPVAQTPWLSLRPTRTPVRHEGREALLDAWAATLAEYRSVEDVRLKVKAAEMTEGADGVVANAKLKFFWLGRGATGQREWVRGRAHLLARQTDERWEILEFDVTDLTAAVAPEDLFHEVGLTAGVAITVPPWGTTGNEEFLAHGCATADVDGDGRLDIFATGNEANYLYRNRGDGTFEDVAMDAFVAVTPPATGPLFLDYDNDGDPDLFLAAIGRQMLFENRLVPDGRAEFLEVSDAAGVAVVAEGFSAVSADVNRDGFPDIYVCSYNKYGQVMPNSWSDATNGTPNLLFVSDGAGAYREAAAEWGVADSRWTYAAQFGDLDGDGTPDLYVANDFGVNAVYLNRGGRFEDHSAELGLDDTGNGMGVSLGDYDNDGRIDVHVTNMSSTAGNRILSVLFPGGDADSPEYARTLRKIAAGNTLFHNEGGTFRNVSGDVGPFGAGWAFGGGFVDFDNDGWCDLHTPNGFISGKGLKDT